MISRNKLSVIRNPYQSKALRVLCVCSGGVLRSPTAAWVLSNEPFNFNTRSCGDADYALIPLTCELVAWADEIVVMDDRHAQSVKEKLLECTGEGDGWPLIRVLGIEDEYDFKDPELIRLMTAEFMAIFGLNCRV